MKKHNSIVPGIIYTLGFPRDSASWACTQMPTDLQQSPCGVFLVSVPATEYFLLELSLLAALVPFQFFSVTNLICQETRHASLWTNLTLSPPPGPRLDCSLSPWDICSQDSLFLEAVVGSPSICAIKTIEKATAILVPIAMP